MKQVKKEIQKCYELIHRLGRGVVYLGSSRMGPAHPHYTQSFELGKEASIFACFDLNHLKFPKEKGKRTSTGREFYVIVITMYELCANAKSQL